ncbi:hypothetical protein [Muricoccus radiodurans]|uniref:hypothetical protein n=1 Tax=Muricoccus radiodurans TaxID=2231721 RepID=UPI003CF6F4CE
MTLSRLFWIVVGSDVLFALMLISSVAAHPRGQFDGLQVLMVLVFTALICVIAGVVALIRKPVAYQIGIFLTAIPALLFVLGYVMSLGRG